MSAQIGRKIYYELGTGNVIIDTGERQGDVVETTEDQDFALYAALQPYQRSAVGVLQLNFGDNAQNFAQYPHHVDITQNPPVVVWDTTATDLANAQAQKIAQLQNMYAQTLAAGFQCDIAGTTYTFGWQQDATHNDQLHLSMVQQAIDKGVETFPVAYADINSNPVSIPDQTALTALDTKATAFGWAQVKQLRSLIGQAKATTTVDAVNAVQWTPGSY